MSGEVLSQAEIDMLLSASDSSRGPRTPGNARPTSSGTPEADTPQAGKTGQTIHGALDLADSTRSLDNDQVLRPVPDIIDALRCIHQRCATRFAADLATLLRADASTSLVYCNQLTGTEFLHRIDPPLCLSVLAAAPLDGQLLLDMGSSILNPLLDRLLGGADDTPSQPRRRLTRIELRLARRIIEVFLSALHSAWQPIVPLALSVAEIASSSHAGQLPSDADVAAMGFEIVVGQARGTLSVCIPFDSLAPFKRHLLSEASLADARCARAIEKLQRGGQGQASRVRLAVVLDQMRVPSGELNGLQVGDILTTQKRAGSPFVLEIEGVGKFRAHPGAWHGRKAIRLDESVFAEGE